MSTLPTPRRDAIDKEKTVLQGKLERLATSIGRVGFAAGLTCTVLLSFSFTQRVFLSGFTEGSSVRTGRYSLHF